MEIIFNSMVLKVVTQCNLNCSYCYEYNRGDTTWKNSPKIISDIVLENIAKRISQYLLQHGKTTFQINLHGGEPTMLGPKKLEKVFSVITKYTPGVKLNFGIQTNATLISSSMIDVLVKYDVSVGASLDGDIDSNIFRVDHRGNSSWKQTAIGIKLLKNASLLSGIQAVINLNSEPDIVLNALNNFSPKIIELTQPYGNHDNLPSIQNNKYTLGEWLSKAFDYWTETPKLQDVHINILNDALYAILSERPNSDWFPSTPPGYFVVTTDGQYEGLDTLKVVGKEGRILGLNIFDNSIEEIYMHKYHQLRSDTDQLCNICKECSIVSWCAGGYFPTRYGKGNGFSNPSVYCEDLKVLFLKIGTWLMSKNEIPPSDKSRIAERLSKLILLN